MTTSMRKGRRVTAALAGGAAAALLLSGLAGCQGDAGTTASDTSVAGPTAAEPAAGARSAGGLVNAFEADGGAVAENGENAASAGDAAVRERAVISSASMSVSTPDVAESRAEVRSLLDRVQGLVAEEETQADDEGRLARARMVLRVPSDAFDTALVALAELGEVDDESRTSEDVTTKVIDTQTRVRAQQRSIKRIETLLDRAETLGQVVRIESELSRRQADLDSLLAQQAWLGEQSSLATIALTLRAQELVAEVEEEDEPPAFVAGVLTGWDSLLGFLGGAATLLGVLLPWLVLVLLLGVPLWVALRSARRRRTVPAEA
jgi:hypothetical protein